MDGNGVERFETVVIGSGQAGLSTGYYLKEAGRSFVIVDAHDRVGGSWLSRYDSLKLFTPPWAIKLPGWRFPRKGGLCPTKDEMIDYLRAYASRFDLPVRTGLHVDRISRESDGYVLSVGGDRIEADNVIVASRPIGTRGSLRSLGSSIPGSCSSIRASTATRRSCARAACSWLARATRAPTSRSTLSARIPPGSRVRSWARARRRRQVVRAERGVPDHQVLGAARDDDPDADRSQVKEEVRVPG